MIEPIVLDEQNKCIRTDGTIGTLTTDGSSPKHNNRVIELNYDDCLIRKLTPLECYRLMGFDDEDFYYAAYGRDIPIPLAKRVEKRDLSREEWKVLWRVMRHQQVSNSQLYKQAGNSIVVNVLEAIFKEML